ncbi:MAG: helix-turn-helix domain-containing protein [Candidatus Hydrogenedens sp.]|nr:helix-turn-helix domain-containing protein [Candidatus Hydrogenedens sp.]
MAYSEEQYRVPPPGMAADPVRTPAELERMAARRKAADTTKRRKESARKRWMLLNAFADSLLADAGPVAGAVWLALFRFARPDGTVFASLPILEAMTGQHRRTIQRGINRLSELGALEKVQRGGGGMASIYRLLMPGGGVAESD